MIEQPRAPDFVYEMDAKQRREWLETTFEGWMFRQEVARFMKARREGEPYLDLRQRQQKEQKEQEEKLAAIEARKSEIQRKVDKTIAERKEYIRKKKARDRIYAIHRAALQSEGCDPESGYISDRNTLRLPEWLDENFADHRPQAFEGSWADVSFG